MPTAKERHAELTMQTTVMSGSSDRPVGHGYLSERLLRWVFLTLMALLVGLSFAPGPVGSFLHRFSSFLVP